MREASPTPWIAVEPRCPEIDLVEVGLEDLALLVAGLDDQGHQGFLDLARPGALGGEEEVLDQLLGEGASPLTNPAGPQVREHGTRDASQIDARVALEALVLHGEHGVDQVARQLVERDELALLAIGSVVGADALGLEQHGAELVPAPHRADLANQRAREPQDHVARGLRSTRVLEGAQVDPHPVRAPHELTRGQRATRLRLAIAETQQRPPQVDQLPVESGVEDLRRGVDLGGHVKEHALEAVRHDPIEARDVHDRGEAEHEGEGQHDGRHPAQPGGGAQPDVPERAPGAAASPGRGRSVAGGCRCDAIPCSICRAPFPLNLRAPAMARLRPPRFSPRFPRMSDESQRVGSKAAGRKPWGGRFASDTDPAVERFTASIHFDRALAQHDLRLSRAHAAMLHAQGLIDARDEEALQEGLDRVEAEIQDGSFPIDPALEDIHMHVEARLAELVGTPAGRLHTGRSRNDQVATDLLLYLREASLAAQRGLHELRAVLLARAREHLDTVLPGYTHLQRAQPVRLAHHWLAFVAMFGRDAARFADLVARFRHAPLGSGALAGSTLPLDRERTARELGFEGPSANSMDAVASRDAGLEFLSCCAIAAVHLSRIAEELVLWSSAEFGFVELADAYSTGSSLMPQKKNPDVPELVRGKSGRVIGNLVTLLTIVKGLPLTYNRDLQEDKEPVFDSATTLRDCLAVTAGALATLRVDEVRMREAASDPMLLATDLAEALVREGVPFREAHEAVGRVVGHCVASRGDLRALSHEDLQGFHPAFPGSAQELLSLERALEERSLVGGTATRHGRGRALPRRGRGARGTGRPRRGSRPVTRRLALALTLVALTAACGRYGPPVRAPRAQALPEATSCRGRGPRVRPGAGARPGPGRERRRRRGFGMSELPFTKMHGAGNDFVVLDGIRSELPPLEPLAAQLCDRHFGIGADQLLVVRPSQAADFRMEIFNADGSQVEMCANGIRCFYKYLRDAGHTAADEIGVETLSGVVRPRWAGPGRVTVDMGLPVLAPAKIPTTLGSGDGPVLDVVLTAEGQSHHVSSVSMGNPHAVLYVDDPDCAPVTQLGPAIEHHAAFPNRVNVEFVAVVSRDRIRQRTWERGTGETLACGSGACAVAVVSMLRGVVDREVTIELRGGELRIAWPDASAHVEMTGPAADVFSGSYPIPDPPVE